MKLAILGGGGFRVPLVYGALLDSPITAVVLHDIDPRRLQAISRVLAAQARGVATAPAVSATTDLTEALTGADFVFSAIRVGGLEGRVADEQVALAAGVLGQETVGAGGISYGLRTVPVATMIARRIALVAPAAWVINFTNPAGLVTEAMAAHLGDRVIGICDSPSALGRRVLRTLGVTSGATLEYAGLNHLGWLSGVRVGNENLLPRLLADPALVESFEEGRLFGVARLRELAAVPNEYLHYYYDTEEVLRKALAAPETRGEFLLRQQQECYEMLGTTGRDPLQVWDEARRQREATYMSVEGLGDRDEESAEGGGYEDVALALMLAIATDSPAELILNVRNRGTLPFLDDDAVVEVPCRADGAGAHPHPVSVPAHGVELVRRVKATERAVLDAAASGSRAVAVRAMASHPLIDAVPVARRLITGYQARFPELAYLR